MKALFQIIIISTLFLFSCKTNKTVTEKGETESSMKATFHELPMQFCAIKGTVKGADSGELLAGAVIEVRGLSDSFYTGVVADENGNFQIEKLKIGEYSLEVKYISYQNFDTFLKFESFGEYVVEIALNELEIHLEKPVIYLYPPESVQVNVKINFEGELKYSYPHYMEGGWNVFAQPDGTLWDENGLEYYALFWEGVAAQPLSPKDGFVVPGSETAAFLEEKLAVLGLNRREANEFIMYWLPLMEDNPYNFIHFSGEKYEAQAELIVAPQPETMIRVMMLTQPLQQKIDVPVQDLSLLQKERKGFVLVEWGGSIVQNAIKGI